MPDPITCLNCETSFSGDFCPSCAQRASTGRLDFRKFLSWDYLSEHLNLDRGIFHTMAHLAYRPGHLINDYLAGKRKRYFNFVGFLLIMLGVEALLTTLAINTPSQILYEAITSSLEANMPNVRGRPSLQDVKKMMASQKFIFMLVIPIVAFFNRLIFRRMGYNLMEHSVAITFMLAMNTMFGFALLLFGMFNFSFATYSFGHTILSVYVFLMGILLFWQFSKAGNYTNGGRLWRALLAYAVVTIVLGLSLQAVIGIFAGYRNAEVGNTEKIELFEQQ